MSSTDGNSGDSTPSPDTPAPSPTVQSDEASKNTSSATSLHDLLQSFQVSPAGSGLAGRVAPTASATGGRQRSKQARAAPAHTGGHLGAGSAKRQQQQQQSTPPPRPHSDQSPAGSDLDGRMAAAASEVAAALPGNPDTTVDELLSRIAGNTPNVTDSQSIKLLFGGMRVESKKRHTPDNHPAPEAAAAGDVVNEDQPLWLSDKRIPPKAGGQMMWQRQQRQHGRQQQQWSRGRQQWQEREAMGDQFPSAATSSSSGSGFPTGQLHHVDLDAAEPLGIFDAAESGQQEDIEQPCAPATSPASDLSLVTWSSLERRRLSLLCTRPPRSAWQEMAAWTDTGLLWPLPVDNERGSLEDASVGFEEHIFLERYLEPWCPRTGPIRKFMTLVCTALSTNFHYTAQEKREHLHWFQEYFAKKQSLLEELDCV